MLLAFDDTDSPDGGCTTQVLFEVLAALDDLAPRGMPRLVRLNPNVPWKTRGNGAVCVELVRPTGPHVVVGEWQGLEMRAYPDGEPAEPTTDVLETVWAKVSQAARSDAMPAVALFEESPSPLAYWEAVRTLVEPSEAKSLLDAGNTLHKFRGDGRALIGCLAAAGWPGPASSYEFIAYRSRSFWGTTRSVRKEPLFGLDATGITFHTEDIEEQSLCCIPNTPCPVLLGLRGRDPERLLQTARSTIPLAAEEPLAGWILWATNQASGHHISQIPGLAEAIDGMTISVPATVESLPQDLAGGHVCVRMRDMDGASFDAMAFEPTKSFRGVVRQLRPEDQVVVVGGFAEQTVRLEQLHVTSTSPEKSANPTHCKRPMKSRGQGAGYKCQVCGGLVPETAATFEERLDLVTSYEVPVMARRHLHRPLSWEQESTPHVAPDASVPERAANQ